MIYYFSGTGNSHYVASKLKETLHDQCISMNDLIKKEDHSLEVVEGNLIFVFPTYAWRIPRIVEEWIKKTTFKEVKGVYFIMTCGENIGNAGYYNEILCKEKGFIYKGTLPIIMPENYLALFNTPDDKKAKEIIQKAEPSINKAIEYIKAQVPFPGMSLHLKDKAQSSFVNSIFYKFFVGSKSFYTTDCKGCGLCEKLCPLNNIHLEDHKPIWGDQCTHCMACIAKCPFKAIEYGKHTKNQNRYHID